MTDPYPGLYNISNGIVAPDAVNVQDALAIGIQQSQQMFESLSSDFHKPLTKQVKTMEVIKKSVTFGGKATHDLETLFSCQLLVGQQRAIEVADMLKHELSPVPPALVDEYGSLRKGNKSALVRSIGVFAIDPPEPDVVLVDAGQLLFHVVWPSSGTTLDLAQSFASRLSTYPPESKKKVIFDRYEQGVPCPKEHEQSRRGCSKEVRLTTSTPLPSRETILHN